MFVHKVQNITASPSKLRNATEGRTNSCFAIGIQAFTRWHNWFATQSPDSVSTLITQQLRNSEVKAIWLLRKFPWKTLDCSVAAAHSFCKQGQENLTTEIRDWGAVPPTSLDMCKKTQICTKPVCKTMYQAPWFKATWSKFKCGETQQAQRNCPRSSSVLPLHQNKNQERAGSSLVLHIASQPFC